MVFIRRSSSAERSGAPTGEQRGGKSPLAALSQKPVKDANCANGAYSVDAETLHLCALIDKIVIYCVATTRMPSQWAFSH